MGNEWFLEVRKMRRIKNWEKKEENMQENKKINLKPMIYVICNFQI